MTAITDIQEVLMLGYEQGREDMAEEIITKLMTLYNITCCCDSATFGDHYLSHKQPDNLIDMIRKSSQAKSSAV